MTTNTAQTEIPNTDNGAGKIVQIANCLTATL